jgi:hypothetical protein
VHLYLSQNKNYWAADHGPRIFRVICGRASVAVRVGLGIYMRDNVVVKNMNTRKSLETSGVLGLIAVFASMQGFSWTHMCTLGKGLGEDCGTPQINDVISMHALLCLCDES